MHKQKRRHFHAKTTVHWRSTHGARHIPLKILRFRSAIYRLCGHFYEPKDNFYTSDLSVMEFVQNSGRIPFSLMIVCIISFLDLCFRPQPPNQSGSQCQHFIKDPPKPPSPAFWLRPHTCPKRADIILKRSLILLFPWLLCAYDYNVNVNLFIP